MHMDGNRTRYKNNVVRQLSFVRARSENAARRAVYAPRNDSIVPRFYEFAVKACHYGGCGMGARLAPAGISDDLPRNFMNLYSIRPDVSISLKRVLGARDELRARP